MGLTDTGNLNMLPSSFFADHPVSVGWNVIILEVYPFNYFVSRDFSLQPDKSHTQGLLHHNLF